VPLDQVDRRLDDVFVPGIDGGERHDEPVLVPLAQLFDLPMLLVDADLDAAGVHLRHVHWQDDEPRSLWIEPAHDLEDLALRLLVRGLDDLRVPPEPGAAVRVEEAGEPEEDAPDAPEPHEILHRPRQVAVRRVRLRERVDVAVDDLHDGRTKSGPSRTINPASL
jgi:hypothetical protein